MLLFTVFYQIFALFFFSEKMESFMTLRRKETYVNNETKQKHESYSFQHLAKVASVMELQAIGGKISREV